MPVYFEVTSGPDAGQVFEYPNNTSFVIGRDVEQDAGLQLPSDRFMSRHHFLVSIGIDDCVVRDCGSSNGLFVNGIRSRASALREGDQIKAGHTTIVVSFRQAPVVQPLEAVGQKVEDRFKLLEGIPSGGSARVYRAVDLESDQPVALKFLRVDLTDAINRMPIFMRELEAAKSLSHAHIVPIRAVGLTKEEAWIAADWIDGPTLTARVENGPLFSERQALHLARSLLRAVAYAHGKGYIHRDIKPDNILLAKQDWGYRPMLGDFGLAKRIQERAASEITSTGTIRGTPRYMSPEQLLNSRNAGPPADIFATAACIYYALTGRWHYDEGEQGVMPSILEGQVIPARERRRRLSPEIDELLLRGLAKGMKDRFPTANAFMREVESVLKKQVDRTEPISDEADGESLEGP